jgi:uncharacterized protein
MPEVEFGPLELLILQGTPFCNIDCTYCYLPDRLDTSKMNLDIVRHTISNLVKEKVIRDDFTVLWHAGEPLVLPMAHYEEAIQIIRAAVPLDFKIKFAIQTNGMLLTDSWCQFFAKHNVELGMSIDGPEFIHDRNRITRSGKGTFSKVMDGVGLLRKHGLNLDIIAVVTAFSCDYPEQMYEFFREIGANTISFNVEEEIGVNTVTSFTHMKSARDKVKNFLRTMYRLNLQDKVPIGIREYDWAKNTMLGSDLDPKEIIFSQLTGTFKIVTVSTKGDFSTYSPELNGQKSPRYGDFILGNVLKDSFIDSTGTTKFKLIYHDLVQGLKKCKKNCGYYGLCPGGVPSTKFNEHKTLDVDETLYCKLGVQAPIDALLEMAEEELRAPVQKD